MSKLSPQRVWWHSPFGCGAEIALESRPTSCKCKADVSPAQFSDLGYRVGYNSSTYSYYSAYDAALKDKRCK